MKKEKIHKRKDLLHLVPAGEGKPSNLYTPDEVGDFNDNFLEGFKMLGHVSPKPTKEKTYKTWQSAIKKQKEGECAVFDKRKKVYVNIKDFPPYVDPFEYNPLKSIPFLILGGIVGSIWGPATTLIGILFAVMAHCWITYVRHQ